MRRINIAVLASGSGSNLQALLDHSGIAAAPFSVALVASDRGDAGALTRANHASVPTLHLDSGAGDAATLLAALGTHRIELIVLAGYLKLVPRAVVDAFKGRMLNIHPALLPLFGGPGMYGRKVHAAVLASGARVSGATMHLVDEAYDRGTIIAQWPVPVKTADTAESLASRVLLAEHKLIVAVARSAATRIARGLPIVPLDLAADQFGPSALPAPECDDALVSA